MVGGIALALARGWDLDDAVQFGVAAGSAAVMAPGHQLCRREDTEVLFERMRVHAEAVAV
jgi:6-phosphofructokinase 2